MPVEDPGTLTVRCDNCAVEIQADTTEYTGDPTTFGVEEQTLLDLGWSVESGETFCTDCTEERQNEDNSST